MSDLTIGRIVKMTIAVFVIVMVIWGISLAFSTYVLPAFDGIAPEIKDVVPDGDGNVAVGGGVASERVVATLKYTGLPWGHYYIYFVGYSSVSSLYVDDGRKIYNDDWGGNSLVGSVDENGKIKMNVRYTDIPDLTGAYLKESKGPIVRGVSDAK